MKGKKNGSFNWPFNLLRGMVFIFLTAVPLYLAGCASDRGHKSEPYSGIEESTIEERWGIKIEGMRLASAGYMLDFRYRVIDPEKALPIFDRNVKPYLLDQETGAKFIVPSPPKVGPLRQNVKNGLPPAGKTYFMFFSNPDQYVKIGKKVTVVIGEFKAENIVVQ